MNDAFCNAINTDVKRARTCNIGSLWGETKEVGCECRIAQRKTPKKLAKFITKPFLFCTEDETTPPERRMSLAVGCMNRSHCERGCYVGCLSCECRDGAFRLQ